MSDIKTLEKIVVKLNKDTDPGQLAVQEGAKHRPFTYYLNDIPMFSFGITRSSKIKSKNLPYIHHQMKLTRGEYIELYSCTFGKADLNSSLLEQEEN